MSKSTSYLIHFSLFLVLITSCKKDEPNPNDCGCGEKPFVKTLHVHYLTPPANGSYDENTAHFTYDRRNRLSKIVSFNSLVPGIARTQDITYLPNGSIRIHSHVDTNFIADEHGLLKIEVATTNGIKKVYWDDFDFYYYLVNNENKIIQYSPHKTTNDKLKFIFNDGNLIEGKAFFGLIGQISTYSFEYGSGLSPFWNWDFKEWAAVLRNSPFPDGLHLAFQSQNLVTKYSFRSTLEPGYNHDFFYSSILNECGLPTLMTFTENHRLHSDVEITFEYYDN